MENIQSGSPDDSTSSAPPAPMSAGSFADRLNEAFQTIKETLQPDERIVISAVGAGERIEVTSAETSGPYMLLFHGTDQYGNRCSLVTHVDAAQVLIKVEKYPQSFEVKRLTFPSEP